MSRLTDELQNTRKIIDVELDKLLPTINIPENRVVDAMRYSAIGAGKALRPFLVITCAKIFGVPTEVSVRTATALEMVHTYSLIHDDLPAMDDDDLRRGKPSCHKQFDEATAILAGDALLTRAFEVLASEQTCDNPTTRCELIALLANYAGTHGMIGGQMLDLLSETDMDMSLTDVVRLQSLKTGKMISFACEAGAILGRATFEERQILKSYAEAIGLAFQISDDILDLEGSVEKVGKTLRKDVEAGKATYVSVVGIEKARAKAIELIEKAKDLVDAFGERADLLKELANFILLRDY